ncbi:hypothetical protein, partial [Salmonella enterica]|uniref:hypothetical protein n=1 Tax=Salmonella enterica TaxID=28901 RepID=UPI001E331E25
MSVYEKILQSVPERVHCEVLLFKNLDQAEKLKHRTTKVVRESLKFSQHDDESKETSSGCEV